MSNWRGQWRETNRGNWDERVPIHVSGEFYDVEGFKAGAERLRPFEIEEVGDVAGKDLIHLRCHFGVDTLNWARRGACVTGLDFSAPAVEAAASNEPPRKYSRIQTPATESSFTRIPYPTGSGFPTPPTHLLPERGESSEMRN